MQIINLIEFWGKMSDSIIFLYLSFPILFMFHELEEIAFMTEWMNRLKKDKLGKLPQLFKKLDTQSHQNFTLIVFEEYFLIIIIAGICYLFSYHAFYVALIISYNIHILIHVMQAFFLKSYVPGLISGVLSFSILTIILSTYINIVDLNLVLFLTPINLLIVFINLFIIHKIIR